ncbi:MAG: type I-F CRISPR-associated protein Csy2 [Proteobacteria bacterium]|nr:MAG: type I-F CRISPR-associated protein Csy2 [Pseudomonadota bacterium]
MNRDFLLIPNIRIHNANALSSPYTIGFPAMTAWMGAVHALQRHLCDQDFDDIVFNGVGVVCHDYDLQTYKGEQDYVHSIVGTGNPLDKSGNRPSFIEEARIHLTVSLLIEIEDLGFIDFDELTDVVNDCLQGRVKLAGGDVLMPDKSSRIEIINIESNEEERRLLRRLMPGHCLLERRDLMEAAMQDGQDGIDALLDYLKVTHQSELDENGKTIWKSSRKSKGWIVPIATGFQGISDLGLAEQQRDPATPHRFAESLVTLGEFVMPYRLNDIDQILWHYHVDAENNLYTCRQQKPTH